MSRSHILDKSSVPFLSALLLFLQAVLVLTGGAVRLTSSGLGCPTWPQCTPGSYAPIQDQVEGQLHAWIEFGNRLLTFALIFTAVITFLAVMRAGRLDLRPLAIWQILGIFGQGLLGGITVLTNLHPIAVGSHYLLSALLIAGATSLYMQRNTPSIKKIPTVQSLRFSYLHLVLTFIVLSLGTIVTGAGPHAGDVDAPRLIISIINATLFHALAVSFLIVVSIAFYLSSQTPKETKRLLVIFLILTFAQGFIGLIQYIQGVPELLVATHLFGSVLVWIGAWKIWLSINKAQIGAQK